MEAQSTVTISHAFRALIPNDVRERTKAAKGDFDFVGLVGEAEKWEYDEEVAKRQRPIPVDPLVIGVKNGRGYLIDSFDLSPIEEMVAREFTTGPCYSI